MRKLIFVIVVMLQVSLCGQIIDSPATLCNSTGYKHVDLFLELFGDLFCEMEKKYYIDSRIIAAHSALETGYGRYIRYAYKNKTMRGETVFTKNLFNIMSHNKKDVVGYIYSEEIHNRRRIRVKHAIRLYDSYQQSCDDYIRVIRDDFPGAWKNRYDYKRYFRELQRRRYATDTNYADICISVYSNFGRVK